MYNRTIAVVGARECEPDTYRVAERLGTLIAESGYAIICGGLGGVMEAVCKGAKSKNGRTIGVLPGENKDDANPYVDVVIATGMGIGRNLIIIRSADVVISINGGFGTLSEISFALQLGKTVIGINTWDVSDQIKKVDSVEDAMKIIASLFGEL